MRRDGSGRSDAELPSTKLVGLTALGLGAVLVVAITTILWASRSGGDWDARIIDSFGPLDDNHLAYEVGTHCHPEARASLTEGADRVVITFETRGELMGDCADGIEITLDEPLGDRIVIDATTGSVVHGEG